MLCELKTCWKVNDEWNPKDQYISSVCSVPANFRRTELANTDTMLLVYRINLYHLPFYLFQCTWWFDYSLCLYLVLVLSSNASDLEDLLSAHFGSWTQCLSLILVLILWPPAQWPLLWPSGTQWLSIISSRGESSKMLFIESNQN